MRMHHGDTIDNHERLTFYNPNAHAATIKYLVRLITRQDTHGNKPPIATKAPYLEAIGIKITVAGRRERNQMSCSHAV